MKKKSIKWTKKKNIRKKIPEMASRKERYKERKNMRKMVLMKERKKRYGENGMKTEREVNKKDKRKKENIQYQKNKKYA